MADIIRFPLFGGKLGVYGTDSFAYNAKIDLGVAEMKRLSILDKDEREQILLNRVSSLILNKLYGYGNLHFYDENGDRIIQIPSVAWYRYYDEQDDPVYDDVVCEVRDDGTIPLASYRRIIIKVEKQNK